MKTEVIKIIVSGTYSGYKPFYSTDGIIEDDITKHLLDRRSYLSADSNSLYRDGYSFQSIFNRGILYHKIILLYDRVGRDGFMMASLFLPEDKILSGEEIKEALDYIVKVYKSYTAGGTTTVELDWSFVKGKADELNAKVQSIPWGKKPSNSDPSKTALIHGAENRVADFFQYPNPLNSGCTGYGQVFLTESLLDPAMASDDSEQGYKVLTTDDVDIDNPEYAIVYENKQQGARLSGERRAITKKELDSHPGNISLGTLAKPGYRSAEVMIKEADKTSKDGFAIIVTLPTLVQMRATVELTVMDNNSKAIPVEECTIEWSASDSRWPEKRNVTNGKYIFLGEECGKTWQYTVKKESYLEGVYNVFVGDGENVKKTIRLTPKPMWTIVTRYPGVAQTSLVEEDCLQRQVDSITREVERQGFRVDKTEDTTAKKVTINGTPRPVPTPIIDAPQVIQREKIDGEDLPRTSVTYFLPLDKKSLNYSLFKNYRRKADIEKKLNSTIKQLEGYSASPKYVKTKSVAGIINKIIECLRVGNLESANDEIKKLPNNFVSNDRGKKVVDSAKDAIKLTKKRKQIPDVVLEPTDVEYRYDGTSHWLECSRSEVPGESEKIVFGKDEYSYSFSYHPNWTKGRWGNQTNSVQRKMLKKYKYRYWALGGVVTVVSIALIYLLIQKRNNPQKDTLLRFYEETQIIERDYPECYCGDSPYARIDSLHNLLIDSGNIQKDSLYVTSSIVYERQKSYKKTAYSVFEESIRNISTSSKEDLDRMMNDERWMTENPVLVLSISQKDSLKALINRRFGELDEAQYLMEKTAEEDLYNSCMSKGGSIPKCDEYIGIYSNKEYSKYSSPERLVSVKNKKNELGLQLINVAKDESKSIDIRKKACSDYCKYFPGGIHYAELNSLKAKLSNESRNNSQNNSDKTEITSLDEVFEILTWNVVKAGNGSNANAFNNKYTINVGSRNHNVILNGKVHAIIENAVKLSRKFGKDAQRRYEEAYGEVKKDNKEDTAMRKLDELNNKLIDLLQ